MYKNIFDSLLGENFNHEILIEILGWLVSLLIVFIFSMFKTFKKKFIISIILFSNWFQKLEGKKLISLYGWGIRKTTNRLIIVNGVYKADYDYDVNGDSIFEFRPELNAILLSKVIDASHFPEDNTWYTFKVNFIGKCNYMIAAAVNIAGEASWNQMQWVNINGKGSAYFDYYRNTELVVRDAVPPHGGPQTVNAYLYIETRLIDLNKRIGNVIITSVEIYKRR